jgi:hypothetical protein
MTSNLQKVSVDPKLLTNSLAFDMASQLISTKDILAKYELTQAQLKTILKSDEFKAYFKEAKLAWESDPEARVRAKAAAAVEDGLLPVHTILHDQQMSPQARLEAFKQLTGLANLGPKKDIGGGAGSVAITINVPSRNEPIEINAQAIGHDEESS